jgi:hypothetical protein
MRLQPQPGNFGGQAAHGQGMRSQPLRQPSNFNEQGMRSQPDNFDGQGMRPRPQPGNFNGQGMRSQPGNFVS